MPVPVPVPMPMPVPVPVPSTNDGTSRCTDRAAFGGRYLTRRRFARPRTLPVGRHLLDVGDDGSIQGRPCDAALPIGRGAGHGRPLATPAR